MARKFRRTAILAYTDGACSGNPGPAGIGVVLVCGDQRKEICEYIGEATSNIAEVTAVIRALAAIKDRTRHVILHSDSEYAIGALSGRWKLRANRQLVGQARALAASFAQLRLEWVPAHAGVPENERCDALARLAIRRQRAAVDAGSTSERMVEAGR
jgi:ribonuclease HI